MDYVEVALSNRAGPNETGLTKTSVDSSLEQLSDEDRQMIEIIGPMTDERRKAIDELACKINLSNDIAITQYGHAVQLRIARFSQTMLSTVDNGDIAQVNELLTELDSIIRNFNPERMTSGRASGLFRRANNRTRPSVKDASKRIQDISDSLRNKRINLIVQKNALNRLYKNNRNNLQELADYILAGRRCLEAFYDDKISGSQEDVSTTQVSKEQYVALGERIADLELSKALCIQMACQIQLVQTTYNTLIERLGSYTTNTVAAWGNQTSLAIGIECGRQAIEEVSDILGVVGQVASAINQAKS